MSYAFVCSGLPASGKSTARKKHLSGDDFHVFSTDDWIDNYAEQHQTTYNAVFHDVIDQATRESFAALHTALKTGKPVFWDRTTLTEASRAKAFDTFRQYDYHITLLWFVPPVRYFDMNVWYSRLCSRDGKVIPPKVLANMINSFERPRNDEDFDVVHFVNIWGDIDYQEYVDYCNQHDDEITDITR